MPERRQNILVTGHECCEVACASALVAPRNPLPDGTVVLGCMLIGSSSIASDSYGTLPQWLNLIEHNDKLLAKVDARRRWYNPEVTIG